MARLGQAAKELLLEMAQTELKTIPPFQQDKVNKVLREIKEHHEEMTAVIMDAERKTRTAQGLPEGAPLAALPWADYPEEYTAMMTHMSCIEHYKRALLAYVMARLERLKHLHWSKQALTPEVRANLWPFELDFLQQYDQNLKRYAQSIGLGMDLTMEELPPKSTCVQVRVLADHGDMMSKEGKVVLKKDTVHMLPLDEVEHLMRAGVVEYLHAGITMVCSMAELATHQHGKSRVRLGRVWRDGDKHSFVEWSVDTMLESDMAHAFLTSSNAGMTPTDTQKNTVYYMAKKLHKCSAEEFAIALARHFVQKYPKVSKAKVTVTEAAWERVIREGQPHNHGFQCSPNMARTAHVEFSAPDRLLITAGFKDWKVLKTTQSGYEGYLEDEFTLLKPTRERIVATNVTASWRYTAELPDYDAAFRAVTDAMAAQFFGPPLTGLYSPSVQFTLYQMARAAIEAVQAVDSVYLNMPNLHFLPCSPVASPPFDNDVFVATSEPHGNIEATITRGSLRPHARL